MSYILMPKEPALRKRIEIPSVCNTFDASLVKILLHSFSLSYLSSVEFSLLDRSPSHASVRIAKMLSGQVQMVFHFIFFTINMNYNSLPGAH